MSDLVRYPRQSIRAISLGFITHGDRVFVAEGYDHVNQSHFYRPLGGGIDFGETSINALKREFQEELRAELTNIQLLACLENIFTYNGKPGHEVIFFYQCDFTDQRFYGQNEVSFMEEEDIHLARWIEGDRFKSGELRLVPPACIHYLP